MEIVPVDLNHVIGLATIDADDMYKHLEQAIQVGSKANLLYWRDFSFEIFSDVHEKSIKDMKTALEAGMRYLDAVYYLCAKDKPAAVVFSKKQPDPTFKPDYTKISNALFSWYFSLYSQGTAIGNGPNNFLANVLGLGNGWKDNVKGLTTASIDNFPTSWVKKIKFEGLPLEC